MYPSKTTHAKPAYFLLPISKHTQRYLLPYHPPTIETQKSPPHQMPSPQVRQARSHPSHPTTNVSRQHQAQPTPSKKGKAREAVSSLSSGRTQDDVGVTEEQRGERHGQWEERQRQQQASAVLGKWEMLAWYAITEGDVSFEVGGFLYVCACAPVDFFCFWSLFLSSPCSAESGRGWGFICCEEIVRG